jgi:hypothetical protein
MCEVAQVGLSTVSPPRDASTLLGTSTGIGQVTQRTLVERGSASVRRSVMSSLVPDSLVFGCASVGQVVVGARIGRVVFTR